MSLAIAMSPSRCATLRSGAVCVTGSGAVFSVTGPGAIACLQGLVTQDLDAAGGQSLAYGALLTPKGMIVSDLWLARDGDGCTLIADASARAQVGAVLTRALPPRLARTRDLSDQWRVAWLLGSQAADRTARALRHEVPGPGNLLRLEGDLLLGAAPLAEPFRILATGPAPRIEAFEATVLRGGLEAGTSADLAAMRVLAGWPALGKEIDEKTLPQEVRFDEHGGVSYTKGCYLGQETVARVHFRGHVNRTLQGIVLPGAEAPPGVPVRLDAKEVGRLGSVLMLPDRILALAVLRREVVPGARIAVGNREGKVTSLPFSEEAISK